jgi:hypothetical protein
LQREARHAALAGRMCDHCGGPMPVAMRSHARWCSDHCRSAGDWARPRVNHLSPCSSGVSPKKRA